MRTRWFLFVLLISSVSMWSAVDWPEFRGPTGDGYVPSADRQQDALPLHWSETNNVKWKTEIPLHGISTPVIMDGQVWLTTAPDDGHDF